MFTIPVCSMPAVTLKLTVQGAELLPGCAPPRCARSGRPRRRTRTLSRCSRPARSLMARLPVDRALEESACRPTTPPRELHPGARDLLAALDGIEEGEGAAAAVGDRQVASGSSSRTRALMSLASQGHLEAARADDGGLPGGRPREGGAARAIWVVGAQEGGARPERGAAPRRRARTAAGRTSAPLESPRARAERRQPPRSY